eukprot:4332011-Prymnesium_polylepis.1
MAVKYIHVSCHLEHLGAFCSLVTNSKAANQRNDERSSETRGVAAALNRKSAWRVRSLVHGDFHAPPNSEIVPLGQALATWQSGFLDKRRRVTYPPVYP